MGLDNDIYTVIFTNWVVATIGLPTMHLNPDPPRAQTHHLFIQAQFEGELKSVLADNTTDERIMRWEIVGYENTEADCILCIKVIKKLLHAASVTGGHYHVDSFRITEANQLKSYVLKGHQFKHIDYDDF